MAPFGWTGGKTKLSQFIISHLPSAKIYIEPFCGSAAVFWNKQAHPVEILNDLHSEIYNLFNVLKDDTLYQKLEERIYWTLYSREEFTHALHPSSDDPVDKAYAFYVRQNQGFAGQATHEGHWGRTVIDESLPSKKWNSRKKLFHLWHERLKHVQLDHTNALTCISYWDRPNAVFYLDPPYLMSTRKQVVYHHDDFDHHALVSLLLTIKGKAVLSGYDDHVTYQPLEEKGWTKVTKEAVCYSVGRTSKNPHLRGDNALRTHQKREETLWIKNF